MRRTYLSVLNTACLVVCFLTLFSAQSNADETLSTPLSDQEPVVFPEVRVTGLAIDESLGQKSLNQQQLVLTPKTDTTISDLLRRLPNFQQSGAANLSLNAAEVLPAEVSISGAKPYDSQYQINGLGINSVLDPAITNPFDLDFVAEPPAGGLINSRLLGEVRTYSYDVPARYGGFTGGVVDSRIRPVAKVQQTRIYGRGTGSGLTSFHASTQNEEDADRATNYTLQEHFKTGEFGVEIDLPLNDKTGVLLAASRSLSLIDRVQLGQDITNKRSLDNFVFKLDHEIDATSTMSFTGFLFPVVGDFDHKSWLNSSIRQENLQGGATFEWLKKDALQEFSLLVGFSGLHNERSAPEALLSWRNTPTKDWGTTSRSIEGGYGDVETQQQTYEIKADYGRQIFKTGTTIVDTNVGVDLGLDVGEYKRLEDRVSYNFVADTATVCGGDPFCVDGEQYSNRQLRYPSDSADGHILRLATYGELKESFTYVDLKQGLRVEYDDLQHNLNLSPRASISVFPFADRSTEVFASGGIYYGRALLSSKIRRALMPSVGQDRELNPDGTLQEWSAPESRARTLYRFSDLDTPYSKEFAAGIRQDLFGGQLELAGLIRHTRDEFHRETEIIDGDRFYVLNNLGRTDYESISLSYKREWKRHHLVTSITWQETESTDREYDEPFDQDDLLEEVVFEGDVVSLWELPRSDFNLKWKGTLDLISQLTDRLSLTNSLTYRGSQIAIIDTRTDDAEGRDILALKEFGSSFKYDLKLKWQYDWSERRGFAVSMDIFNVLNHKRESAQKITTSSSNVAEIGRQFWFEVETWF